MTVAADRAASWRDDPSWPRVSLVVCTRDRPVLLTRAVKAAFGQDYPGEIQCVVVFDQSEPEPVDVEPAERRTLTVIRNGRTPGLAGARNSGVAHADGVLVAFCDDDDEWTPTKIRRQVEILRGRPDAVVAATGIRIISEEGSFDRPAPSTATHADLIRSRITALHPSTFVFERADIVDGGRIGVVDEHLPHGYGEDYEFLLRATRVGTVCAIPDPITNIYWNRPSFFAARWDAMAAGLGYILERYPEFAGDRRGRARVSGQVAFATAALGRRRSAVRWALRTLRDDPRQLRGYAALAVACRLVSPEKLVRMMQARGKGL